MLKEICEDQTRMGEAVLMLDTIFKNKRAQTHLAAMQELEENFRTSLGALQAQYDMISSGHSGIVDLAKLRWGAGSRLLPLPTLLSSEVWQTNQSWESKSVFQAHANAR
jgi:hypothetical protein